MDATEKPAKAAKQFVPLFYFEDLRTHMSRSTVEKKCKCSNPECKAVLPVDSVMLELELANGGLLPFCYNSVCAHQYIKLESDQMCDYQFHFINPKLFVVKRAGVPVYHIEFGELVWMCDCKHAEFKGTCKHLDHFGALGMKQEPGSRAQVTALHEMSDRAYYLPLWRALELQRVGEQYKAVRDAFWDVLGHREPDEEPIYSVVPEELVVGGTRYQIDTGGWLNPSF